MIGTGVFTSLGFQLAAIDSGFVILLLWAAGGLASFCGAMSYAELGAALPRSGGEYNFLARIYHPAAGFISGWISASVGFAAPVALAAITFGAYAMSVIDETAPLFYRQILACILVIAMTVIHAGRRGASGSLQVFFTGLKILVILGFCFSAILLVNAPQPIALLPVPGDISVVASSAFAVALIYVSYGYAGWNAATYLSGEVENPQVNLPKILGCGTLIVTVLYVSLHVVFLKTTPAEEMVGKVEIAFVAAKSIFGETGANFTGLIMAALLISTVSAMTIAGPRVLQIIGQDFRLFSFLSSLNRDKIPSNAIFFQSAIALLFIVTSSFEFILVFAGFTIALNSFFTVLGLFVLRWREPGLARPYRTFGYPLTPLIYLALTGWTLGFIFVDRPREAITSLFVIAIGLVFYVIARTSGTMGLRNVNNLEQ